MAAYWEDSQKTDFQAEKKSKHECNEHGIKACKRLSTRRKKDE